MNTKHVTVLIALVVTVAAGPLALRAQSGYDLFQKALAAERADGNLREAIQLYARVVKEFGSDRPLAARALLRMAECYEKLGDPEARKVYERVRREFPDQTGAAAEAASWLEGSVSAGGRAAGPIARSVWGAPDNESTGDSVSPDGRYLSHTDWHTGNLAIRDLLENASRPLTSNRSWTGQFAEFSSISGDGRQVAFGWSNADGFYELRLIGFNGENLRTLYRNPDVQYLQPFDWSPDQTRILTLFARRDRTHQLVLVSLDGSVRVLKSFDWRSPWKAALSPDGRYIAYDFPPDENAPERDLYLLAIDGSREVPLVTHPAHDFLLGWFPRSDRVLFASTRSDANSAWSVRVRNGRPEGEPQLVKPALGQILPIQFSAAGDYFYALSTGRRDVYMATVDSKTGALTGPLTPLGTRLREGKFGAVWSPDGALLAYLEQSALVRGGEGANTLALYAPDTGLMRLVPLRMTYAQRIQWHPDGRAIFVGGSDLRGRRGVFRVDASTGTFEAVVYAAAGRFMVAPDGRTLFYEGRSHPAGDGAIIARNLATGDEHELYRFSGSAGLAVSPDGRWLAVKANLRGPDGSVSPFPSVQIVPAAGGEPRTLVTLQEPDRSTWRQMAWSPDGSRVLFTEHHQELWQVAVAGGPPERVVGGLSMLNSISLHPDGRRLVVSVGNSKYETWVMQGLVPGRQ